MYNISVEKWLSTADKQGLRACFNPVTKTYKKGEIIQKGTSNREYIGILISGNAYLATSNLDDQKRIIDYYEPGNIFGIKFQPKIEENLYYFYARTNCKVEFVEYSKMISCCSKECPKHIQFIDNMLMLATRKSFMHIDILSQKTLRHKLLTFFKYQMLIKGKNTFTIPLTLSELADYLSADRSAMMREIKKLNDEEIIKSDKRKITILN